MAPVSKLIFVWTTRHAFKIDNINKDKNDNNNIYNNNNKPYQYRCMWPFSLGARLVYVWACKKYVNCHALGLHFLILIWLYLRWPITTISLKEL